MQMKWISAPNMQHILLQVKRIKTTTAPIVIQMNSTCHAFKWPLTVRDATAISKVGPFIMRINIMQIYNVNSSIVEYHFSLNWDDAACKVDQSISCGLMIKRAFRLYCIPAIVWIQTYWNYKLRRLQSSKSWLWLMQKAQPSQVVCKLQCGNCTHIIIHK